MRTACPGPESWASSLDGRLPPSEQSSLQAHLAACETCRRLTEEILDTPPMPKGWVSPASRDLYRGLDAARRKARPAAAWPRWRLAAAAAALLLAATLGLKIPHLASTPSRQTASASIGPASRVDPTLNPRLAESLPGMELLAGPGARVARQESPGAWTLSAGSAILLCDGREARLELGSSQAVLRMSSGEVAVRMPPASPLCRRGGWLAEAQADAGIPIEIAVLSGQAEVSGGGRRETLGAGEGLSLAPPGTWTRRRLEPLEPIALRRAVLSPVPARTGAPAGRRLDGSAGMAAWTQDAPVESYQLSVAFRASQANARIGLTFVVDGRSTLWLPAGQTSLADGKDHVLQALLSPAWVTLLADGAVQGRVPRAGFKPNPVSGLEGTGVAVWGGPVEVSSFRLAALR